MAAPSGRPILAAVLCACAAAGAFDLAGKVVDPDGTGRAGVEIRLVGDGGSSVSGSDGTWHLSSGASAVRRTRWIPAPSAAHLRCRGGRVRVDFDGRDASGTRDAFAEPATAAATGRAAATAPDTLLFSWGGRVFLRDTVPSSDWTGIVRVFDTTVDPTVVHGYVQDGGAVYRTVRLDREWMAENLRAPAPGSRCYRDSAALCDALGRLYTWAGLLGIPDSCSHVVCSTLVSGRVRGACPSGWHVPTRSEWMAMEDWVGADRGGVDLASRTGWNTREPRGVDRYGFRALPAGMLNGTGRSGDLGNEAMFWTAGERDGDFAWYWSIPLLGSSAVLSDYDKIVALSARCVRD